MASVDVIVVGAGINGSWTALHLAKQGYKTILLEQVSELFVSFRIRSETKLN